MTQLELSRFYDALSQQAYWMGVAFDRFVDGLEHETWYAMLNWAECQHIVRKIADAHDTMSFARAMGISDGVRRAFE